MANLNSEERRKRYSRWNRNEDIEQSEANKDSDVITKADERRNRYASKDFLEKYNAYHTPTRSDGSALNRYMNAYGLNQQRSAERQQEARNRYNQQQFMNNQRRYVNGENMNPNGLSTMKTLNDPIYYQRLADAYQKSTGISVEQNNNLERLYGNDRRKLKQAKEDLERTHQNNTPEYNWIKNKLVSTASAEENEERQKTLNRLIGEADDKLASYADKVVGSGIDNPEYLAQVESIKKEKEKLENELENYKDNIDYTTAQDYKYYKAKGDADKSNHVKFVRENSDETIAKYWSDYDYGMQDKNLYNGVVDFPEDEDFIRAITQDEADQYSYLLGKYGEEKAEEYLKGLAKHTDVNGAITKMQEAQEQGKKNFWQSTAESIGLGLLTPAEAVKNLAGFGGKYRTYDDYAIAGRQEALRSGAVQAIQDTNLPGSENVLPFLYNTGSSTADNLLRYIVGGAAGSLTGSASIGEGAMRFMMAGQVGDSAMKQALDRGLTDSQAATTAIISAINEELFETISLSELKAMQTVKPSSYKELAKNVGKQLLGEGSEEVFTDIGNAIADDLVNGEKSEIRTNIRNYMDQGMSEEEAKKQASVDFAMQLVESGLSGGLSGAAMGGLVTGQQANELDNQKKFEQLAQNYMDAGLSEEEAYNAAENDVKANVKTVRDRKGNIKNYKGVKKSLVKAIESTKNLSDNLSKIEQEMKTGVADTTSISDAQNLNETENRFNEAQNEYADTQNEYLNDMQQLLSTEVNNVNDYDTLMEKTDALAKVYPEKRVEISNAVSQVYGSGRDSAEVINELKETNTSPVNETNLKPQINASEVSVANNATTETLPQKMEFKAAVDGNEGVITSVNKNNITIKDATGNEQTVAIKDAQMSDGAMAAVDQAKQYGVIGSRLYLENLMRDNLRNYTVAFNSYYNAGKQGKSFYGLGTFGLMSNTRNNAKVKELLREVYDAGVRDNSKATKQGGLIRNDARYTIQESEARVLDAVGKAFNVTIQMDHMLSHDANGYLSDDVIHISTSAEKPSLVVFSHEFTHRLEDTSPEAYKAYKDYVIDYLKNTSDEEGNNVYETREIDLKNAYARQGVELSDKELQDELVANATESFLSDTDFIEDLVKENKSLAQQILDVLKQMLEDLKNVFAEKYDSKSKEGKALQNDLEAREEALKLWTNAIKNQNKKAVKKNDTRYSMKELETNYDNLAKEYEEAVKKDDEELMGDLEADLSDIVEEYAKKKGFDTLVYHGTQDFGFTKIDTNMSDDKLSFFATDSLEIANSYSDAISEDSYVRKVSDKSSNLGNYEFYANTNNFYEVDAHGQNWNQLRINDNESLLEDINELHNLMKNMDPNIKLEEVYENLDGIADAVENYLTEYAYEAEESFTQVELNRLKQLSKRIDKLVNEWNKTEHYDENGEEQTLYWYLKENKPNYMNTRQIAEMAKNQGYDGVLYKNVHDDGGQSYESAPLGNVYNFFNPQQQVKSADAVTFDDEGKVIPLSERFNKSNDDIRFSLKEDSEGNKLSLQQQEYFKDSKVVDENGNLRVVYHGTGADFTIFDISKARDTEDIEAFFFSGDKEEAEGYGDIKEFYLNIINPADYDTAYDEFFKQKKIKNEGAGTRTREELIKQGYDGIIAYDEDAPDYTEYIAFSPEQIKLVNNKKPTDNPDIRFSLKEDSEGNELSPQQQEFFKDSKVRDADGNLQVLYHQTDADFTVFDPKKKGAGSSDYLTPYGIFMKPGNNNIGLKGNKQMKLYANITNILTVNSRYELEKLLKQNDKIEKGIESIKNIDTEFKEKYDAADKATMDYLKSSSKPGQRTRIKEDPEADRLFKEEQKVLDEWTNAYDVRSAEVKKMVDEYLKSKGYDGVHIIHDEGSFGRRVETFIAFNSNQVKNVDNKKPTDNPDIRFSLKEDSEGNKLTPQQQEFFKDSKAVDDEGNLLVMYHGSREKFTEFNLDEKGVINGRVLGDGFYFTNYKKRADYYGKRGKVFKVYLNIKNPLYFTETTKTPDKIKKILDESNEKKYEEYKKDESWWGNKKNISKDKYVKDNRNNYSYLRDAIYELQFLYGSDENVASTDDVTRTLKDLGYDGIIFDSKKKNEKEIVAFYSNQIKNVDNENPTDNPDIRFSLKEESNIDRNTVAAVTGKDPYMAEAVKDLEDIMRMKGGESFFRANQRELYKIYDEIAKEYNIKDYSKKTFADNVKELFDYIQSVDNPDGVDTTMLGMQIANDMLENGSIIDTTMEDMYPMLQQQLRNYKIKIADQDKADLDAVGGYNAFRKQYFGNLTLSNEGTEVDTVYEDLAASYPELFPEDIVAPGDRLMRIADVVDMFKRTVDHIEGATREESAFIIAQDIINKAVLEQTKNNKSIDNKKRLKAQEKVRKQNTNLKKAKKDIHDDYIRLQNKVKALESINERLDRQLTKAENELGRQKKEFADWAAGKRQVNKEDKLYKQRYDKLMQEFSKKKVAELQKKYSAERRKNIEKIRKMVKELDRSVRRPDKNHYVPPYLVKSMLDVLRTIDLDSGYRKPDGSETLVYIKLKDMQNQYQEMQNDPDYTISSEYNETIDKAIGRLADITRGRRINELLDKDIADIVEVMEIINYQLKTARQLLENEKLDDIKDASAKARQQIKDSGRVFNADAKFKNLANRYLNNTLSPVRVMKRIEGYSHDGVLSALGEELQQGERKTKLLRQKAYNMLEELYKDSKAVKALEDFRTKKLEYTVDGTKKIILTPDMRAAIYLHSLNEQNTNHLLGFPDKDGVRHGGGMLIPNYHKQTKFVKDNVKVNQAEKYTTVDSVRLSESDMRKIINDMTDYEKRIVELYQQVNDFLAKELNDTTTKLYGFKKAKVKNYFPLIVDKSILNLDSDVLKFDKTLDSFGFLKQRVNSAKPIYLEGVMDALERMIDQSSLFSGMAVPSRDFKKVWNYASLDYDEKYDSVKKQAQKSFGGYIDRYVQNLQADLAQARERGTDSGFLNLFSRGKMAAGALTGNISVVLKQAASYPTAAGGVLGYQDLLNGLMPHGQRGKTLEETMKHYTPLYEDRNTAAIAGVNINDMNLLKRRNPKLYYALTGWIEAMDKATVRRLWYASENYVKRNFKYEVGSDAYYEEVAKVWEDTIRKTQPIYDTMNRPEYLRQTNELLKYLMMFKTQAFQNVGIMVENYGEYKARVKDYKKDKSDFNKKELNLATKQLRKSVTSQIIQSIIFTGITALVDATIKHRPDKWADEETGLLTPESLSTKLFDAWTSNVISQLAFGDIIRDSIVNPVRTRITGKEVQRFDISVAPIDAINTIINGLNKSSKYAADGDMDKSFAEIKEVASTASQYGLGLPINNIENLYNGLKGNINDIKSGKNPLKATNEKQMYNRVYIAYAAGDKAEAENLSKDLDQDKLKTKMVSKLKDEETIQEAAEYRYKSDLDSYQAIVDAYVKLGFNEDWVVSAINSVMNKTYDTTGSGEYNSNDLQRAIDISAVQGSKVANELYKEKYDTYKSEGLKDDEAKKKALSSVKSAITGKYKSQYESGTTSQKVKIRDRLCSLRVAGERLYTYDSMKSWNK